MTSFNHTVPKLGVGIGLRREHIDSLLNVLPQDLDFLEVAPENYLQSGGRVYHKFKQLAERYPVLAHGLTLSIGSVDPLDFSFLKQLKNFIKEFNIPWMSDHLCFASINQGQIHDLLPLPFTQEVVQHVVERVKIVQDYLEVPLALEHISYYASLGENEMTESEFINQILSQADCAFHLDINNVYVNSVNHGYDPYGFIDTLPLDRVVHVHMAGHKKKRENWLVDTHGEPIIQPVWDLLKYTAQKIEFPAILIERDYNIPPLEDLLAEMRQMRSLIHQEQDKTTLRKMGAGTTPLHMNR